MVEEFGSLLEEAVEEAHDSFSEDSYDPDEFHDSVVKALEPGYSLGREMIFEEGASEGINNQEYLRVVSEFVLGGDRAGKRKPEKVSMFSLTLKEEDRRLM